MPPISQRKMSWRTTSARGTPSSLVRSPSPLSSAMATIAGTTLAYSPPTTKQRLRLSEPPSARSSSSCARSPRKISSYSPLTGRQISVFCMRSTSLLSSLSLSPRVTPFSELATNLKITSCQRARMQTCSSSRMSLKSSAFFK